MIFIRLKTSSQMVNRVERNELERVRAGIGFLNPGGGIPEWGGIQAPTLPASPPGVGALRPPPYRNHSQDPWRPRAQRGVWPGLGIPHPGRLGSALHPSPNWPAPPKNVKIAPSPLILPRTFPTNSAQRREPGRGPARRDPQGPRATKARPAAPAPRLPFQFSPDLRWN
uniref:Uncharacterized protein n=1 Tax=Sus scrofa TaxID=9823 RepID=A0A8W4FHD0_PIG